MSEWPRMARWIVIFGMGLSLGCSEDAVTAGTTEAGAGSSTARSASNTGSAGPNAAGAAPADATQSEAELIAAGRSVYNANCIACHNMDPTKDGALGPAVAGASHALLEARVVHGNYPEGYKPKRDTRVMVPLPHLGPKIGELTAYLDSLN